MIDLFIWLGQSCYSIVIICSVIFSNVNPFSVWFYFGWHSTTDELWFHSVFVELCLWELFGKSCQTAADVFNLKTADSRIRPLNRAGVVMKRVQLDALLLLWKTGWATWSQTVCLCSVCVVFVLFFFTAAGPGSVCSKCCSGLKNRTCLMLSSVCPQFVFPTSTMAAHMSYMTLMWFSFGNCCLCNILPVS